MKISRSKDNCDVFKEDQTINEFLKICNTSYHHCGNRWLRSGSTKKCKEKELLEDIQRCLKNHLTNVRRLDMQKLNKIRRTIKIFENLESYPDSVISLTKIIIRKIYAELNQDKSEYLSDISMTSSTFSTLQNLNNSPCNVKKSHLDASFCTELASFKLYEEPTPNNILELCGPDLEKIPSQIQSDFPLDILTNNNFTLGVEEEVITQTQEEVNPEVNGNDLNGLSSPVQSDFLLNISENNSFTLGLDEVIPQTQEEISNDGFDVEVCVSQPNIESIKEKFSRFNGSLCQKSDFQDRDLFSPTDSDRTDIVFSPPAINVISNERLDVSRHNKSFVFGVFDSEEIIEGTQFATKNDSHLHHVQLEHSYCRKNFGSGIIDTTSAAKLNELFIDESSNDLERHNNNSAFVFEDDFVEGTQLTKNDPELHQIQLDHSDSTPPIEPVNDTVIGNSNNRSINQVLSRSFLNDCISKMRPVSAVGRAIQSPTTESESSLKENRYYVTDDIVGANSIQSSESSKQESLLNKQKKLSETVYNRRKKYANKWINMQTEEKVSRKFIEKFDVLLFEEPVESLLNIDHETKYDNFAFPRFSDEEMQQQLETTCIAARKLDHVLTEVFDNFYEKLQQKTLEVVSDEDTDDEDAYANKRWTRNYFNKTKVDNCCNSSTEQRKTKENSNKQLMTSENIQVENVEDELLTRLADFDWLN